MTSVSPASRTAFWFFLTFALLEGAARLATRPASLLDRQIASYPTCFAHRQKLARELSGPPVSTLLLGDSTTERGVNACSLGQGLGGRGVGLSFPSGTTDEAGLLLGLAAPHLAPDARVIYSVNPLNIRTYSEWVSPTFGDLVRRSDLATALLGEASTLFGKRQVVVAVLDSLLDPARYRDEFHKQIGLTGECGRETPPPRPDEIPDEKERARQLREYATSWLGVFKEPVGADQEAALAAALASFRPRQVLVVLTPLRPDFRAFLDEKHPGTLEQRRSVWAGAARRAGARVFTCHDSIEDLALYVDPVHLNENGRRSLTACLGARLGGAGGCCAPLGGT